MAFRSVMLENDPDNSINLLDTELGCREPFKAHRDFLVNFLSPLVDPEASELGRFSIHSITRNALDTVYKMTASEQAKKYRPGMCLEVDDWIHRKWSRLAGSTNWWQIVDAIFESGEPLLAKKAQSFAVPLLEDVTKAAMQASVYREYMSIYMPTGESLPEFFCRHIKEVIEEYPVFASPSAFDRGDTRIGFVELHEGVTVKLDTHLWEFDPRVIPNAYMEYHKRRYKADALHEASQMAAKGMDAVMEDAEAGPAITNGIRML